MCIRDRYWPVNFLSSAMRKNWGNDEHDHYSFRRQVMMTRAYSFLRFHDGSSLGSEYLFFFREFSYLHLSNLKHTYRIKIFDEHITLYCKGHLLESGYNEWGIHHLSAHLISMRVTQSGLGPCLDFINITFQISSMINIRFSYEGCSLQVRNPKITKN